MFQFFWECPLKNVEELKKKNIKSDIWVGHWWTIFPLEGCSVQMRGGGGGKDLGRDFIALNW